MRVFKYELRVTDEQDIEMPRRSKILSVAVQNERVCIWALVNEHELVTVSRTLLLHGTGHTVTHPDADFIGTILLLRNGMLVLHAFALPESA